MERLRVAYTFEQCWGRVPGGTGVAALEVAKALVNGGQVEVLGVAGTHRSPPPAAWLPPGRVASVRGSGALLYAEWVFANRPLVERVSGPIDLAHATSLIPCATHRPQVVTVHDLAFRRTPEGFTRWGRFLFNASLRAIRRRADLVLCSSTATMDDCEQAGIASSRLRLVPLGVSVPDLETVERSAEAAATAYQLPARYLLFVGTVEPRKNLARLIAAVAMLDEPIPLLVAGAPGWGDAVRPSADADVRFLGFVPQEHLPGLYGRAAAFCYPSIWEGFGLPVLEAMACGTPVVTTKGVSTEEVAGEAAVLVDAMSAGDIARGIDEALRRHDELALLGRRRAVSMSWATTADLTLAAYREVAK